MVRLLVDLYIELIFILSSVGLRTPDKCSNIDLGLSGFDHQCTWQCKPQSWLWYGQDLIVNIWTVSNRVGYVGHSCFVARKHLALN